MLGWNQETSSNTFLQLLLSRNYFKRLSTTGQREEQRVLFMETLTSLQSKSYERYMHTYIFIASA